jgi:hypothetical protein
MLALEITASKLQLAQQKVLELNANPGEAVPPRHRPAQPHPRVL